MNLRAPTPLDLAGPGSLPRVLLDGMAEGVNLSREDGTIVYVNAAEERMFGYAPGELVGRHVSALNAMEPEDNQARVAEVIATLRRDGAWRGEWLNRRKDGTSFPSRTRITAVEIDGAVHWLCLREDATAEVATREAVLAERARLQLATDAAGLGVWDWMVASGEVSVSDRVRTLFGLPATGPVTTGALLAAIHPEDRETVAAAYRRAIDPALRDRNPVGYRVRSADGAERWILSTGEAIFEHGPDGARAVRYLGAIQDVTERRALEEAERDAARRLRLAIGAGRMAVWEADIAEDRLTGSPELNRLLGFPEDAPLAMDEVRARHAPGEQDRLEAAGQDALARGDTSFEAEFRYLRAPDDQRWLRLRCDILFDEEGRPAKAIGVVFDETARRRAEEALRVSEARLQLAAEAARAGIWDWDLDSGLSVWSPQEYALLGVDPATPPAALHGAWRRLVHPEDLSRNLSVTQKVLRDGGGYVVDYRIERDGQTRWMRSHAVAVAGPDGRPRRLVGIELDVTPERREAEALRARAAALADEVLERRREMERFHALSQDLFAVSGFDGFLKSVNPAWTRLLGYSEEELLSRPVIDFIHPDDRATAIETITRILQGMAISHFQDRLVAKDGRVVWFDWTGVPEGELFYAVGRDVTREREQEEILRHSQKMDALGQLTGGIAHDFNNLLQAVQGSLALIARRPDDPERVRMLAAQGVEAARRGASLTAQLLAFSRSQRLEQKAVAVGPLLRGIEELLRQSLRPLAELSLDLPDDAVTAQVDPTQLEMAVLNLALNARDALGGRGTVGLRVGPVQVEADPELPPGDYVLLEVRDTGAGMTPEVARRAFEPFFTTKGLGKGTGLGLSQVYGMARQAGGTARIETAPGQGTTVRLWLPRATGDSGQEALDLRPPARPVRVARVLVVDDDADVRRWLAAALRPMGHEVLEAADGPGALDALASEPDLALVDFAMPGMNGAEVAARLRERCPGLPVILATGYADSGALPRDLPILRKPFALEDLEAALAATIGSAEA